MQVYPLPISHTLNGLQGLGARIPVGFLITIWSLIVAAGVVLTWNYEHVSNSTATPPAAWPASSGIERRGDVPTLVLFIHPRCPCSHATVEQLSHILAHCDNLVDTHIVFIKPLEVEDGWEHTELWYLTHRMPGVTVWLDHGMAESQRFAVENSGHALLYGTQGELSFSGGITRSPGHQGDNPGQTAIISWLVDGKHDVRETAVYGCSLFSLEQEEP